jgi:transposase
VIRFDPLHVVGLVTDAFDATRRIEWQAMREINPQRAKLFKGARWAPPSTPNGGRTPRP